MPERAGVSGTTFSPYQIQLANGTLRSSGQASGWFGPLAPMRQTVPDEVRGRAFDFQSGYNLTNTPKAYEPISFATLRAVADAYDLLRLVIETRKDQVGRMRWAIKNRDGVKKDYSGPIKAITTFMRKPDGVTPWQDWIRSVLEDLFVLDAPTLYLRRDRAGRLLALEQLDGATIKRVLDDWGRTPQPSMAGGTVTYPVAYQQILKGQPLDYTVRDLIYRPRNRRVHRAYGYGPVEQVLMTVNIALRRQATTLEYFTDGTVPDAFIGVPENWTPSQIKDFQASWDSLFEGATQVRRRAKFVPGGLKVQQTREPELKNDFDLWLAKVVCFAFSIPSSWADRMVNRATAETAKDTAEEEGLAPILDWVKGLVDDVLVDEFGFDDLEFAWQQDEAIDEQAQATVLTTYVSKAMMTPNEGRQKMGLDPDPDPAADKLMVLTATGYVLLNANTIEGKQAMQDAFPQPQPQVVQDGQQGAGGAGAPQANPPPAKPGAAGRQTRSKPVGKAAGDDEDDTPAPIDADDEEQAIVDALAPALGETADDVAAQVRAALKKKDLSREHTAEDAASVAAAIVAGLSFAKLADIGLVTLIGVQLRTVATGGAVRGVDEAAGGSPPVETAAAISAARAAADARAPEMFGLRWVAGGATPDERKLEVDPGAQRSIVDTMRDGVAKVIGKGIAAGSDAAAIAKDVGALALFTEKHARTIAATETNGIGNAALLGGYKASGLTLLKRWNEIGEEELHCSVCNANAKEGAVPLNHVFKSGHTQPGAHPRCQCVLTCEHVSMAKTFDPGQARDARGRWITMGGVKVAAPNVGAINAALGLALPSGSGFMPAKIHTKLKNKRPADYNFTMRHLNEALRRPDLAGLDADHPGRVSLVKRVQGDQHPALLVSINQERDPSGNYVVVTAYPFEQTKIDVRRKDGRLVPTKRASRRRP